MKTSRIDLFQRTFTLLFGRLLFLTLAGVGTAATAQIGNTGTGSGALVSITTGDYNTADGLQALNHDTSGSNNTGVGVNALYRNTAGTYNTASGFGALFTNSTAFTTPRAEPKPFTTTTEARTPPPD
jgi:hypothetical protein